MPDWAQYKVDDKKPDNKWDQYKAASSNDDGNNDSNTLASLWDKVTKPTVNLISDKDVENFTTPHLEDSKLQAELKGFIGGAMKGGSNLVSGLSSPLNIAIAGMGSLEELTGSNIARLGTKILSAPVVAHGASKILSPNSSLNDRFMGATEVAGGLLGMRGRAPEVADRVAQPLSNNPSYLMHDDLQIPPTDVARDFAPVGEEGNLLKNERTPFKDSEEAIYENAKNRFGMGHSIEGNKPNLTVDQVNNIFSNQPPLKEGTTVQFGIKNRPIINTGKVVEPERSDYFKDISENLSSGTPGLKIELDKYGPSYLDKSNKLVLKNDKNIVYRDFTGNPIGMAVIREEKNGNLSILDFGVDKNHPESTKAALEIGNYLVKNNITNSETITPDANNLLKAVNKLRSSKNYFKNNNEGPRVTSNNSLQLPRDLRGAKPRYNIGQDSYIPNFKSDLDKALFIIAQKKESLRNSDYLKFVMDNTGLSREDALYEGLQLRSKLKDFFKSNDPGELDVPVQNRFERNNLLKSTQIENTKTNNKEIRVTSLKPATPELIKQAQEKGPDTLFLKTADKTQLENAAQYGYTFDSIASDGSIKLRKTPIDMSPPPNEPLINNSGGNGGPPDDNGSNGHIGDIVDRRKATIAQEVMNLPRGMMASWDLSAPFRQGLGMITKPEWWKSWNTMFKSFGSENAFRAAQQTIADKPLFKSYDGKSSFAQKAGLQLTDLTDLNSREEQIMSTWAEKVPGVRPSNRAYTAFLNKLRADTFENVIETYKVMNPSTGEYDMNLAKGLAGFVNTSTGRGPLGSLEKYAAPLNSLLFSPRLIASRLQMLNPVYYMTAHPAVRKEAIRSLLGIAGTGAIVTGLGKLAGGTIENDPTSSDFGKLKIGNTRIDPYGGFQQYIVAANRLLQGRTKSSVSGKESELNSGKFGSQTKLDVAERFGESKLNPLINLAMTILRGKNLAGQKVDLPEEVASKFVPLLIQDLKNVATENPNLIPFYNELGLKDTNPTRGALALPGALGMGIQNYPSK